MNVCANWLHSLQLIQCAIGCIIVLPLLSHLNRPTLIRGSVSHTQTHKNRTEKNSEKKRKKNEHNFHEKYICCAITSTQHRHQQKHHRLCIRLRLSCSLRYLALVYFYITFNAMGKKFTTIFTAFAFIRRELCDWSMRPKWSVFHVAEIGKVKKKMRWHEKRE